MKRKIIQIVLISIILIGFCSIVLAEDLEELQTRKSELQEQLNETNEQMSEIQIELTENLEQLNSLEDQILIYEEEIGSLEEEIDKIASEIGKIERKLQIVQENYNAQRIALQNRIVALYESGDVLYLDVLLNSSSISDFISNYFLIGEIARYDKNLLDDIEGQKKQIESSKKKLEEKQNSVKEVKQDKEKAAIALENSRIIRNSYIDKLTDEERQTQEKIDSYLQELNEIESQIYEIAIGDDVITNYIGGEFIWPAPGYYTITSRFGPRIHPILLIPRSHSGTDIACPTGTSILAAGDGVVIKSTYSSTGYGNMVMIDHGGGIVTLYGHGSELIAQTGDKVKSGDVIMKSGSTGWSTGPHLHFEVRVNGLAVDSLPYITGKSNNNDNSKNKKNSIVNNIENIKNTVLNNTTN